MLLSRSTLLNTLQIFPGHKAYMDMYHYIRSSFPPTLIEICKQDFENKAKQNQKKNKNLPTPLGRTLPRVLLLVSSR